MVVELDIRSYLGWLLNGTGETFLDGAVLRYGITFLAVALLSLVGGFLVLLIRYGPMKAGDLAYRGVADGVTELLRLSPRRVGALTYLAIKEALRRRALVALGVFALILVFAGWFLQTNYQEPAKLYLSFVLTAATYLVLILGLLLSTFSLPNDFKSRTIYTIVTKPVRPVDIVLGRILGFTAIGTLMLALMAAGSYVFVNRSLSHTHAIDVDSLENLTSGGEVIGKQGRTTLDAFHRHEVEFDANGDGAALTNYRHKHDTLKDDSGELVTTAPLRLMRARVPKLGSLGFVGRNGEKQTRGVNTGNEWTYRSSIEGGTAAAAVWTFQGVSESDLRVETDGKVLPIELIVRVFRTHKGNVERAIQGTIQLRNPDTELTTGVRVFPAKDYLIDTFDFPMEQYDTDQNPINLMDDLVTDDGRISVVVQALDRAQYFSFAQADCYIRLPDGSPLWNFVKACLSIWAQMVVVITIGVTASTFLNGPIATLFTVSTILLGFKREFFINVARGDEWGGGPIESAVRMVTQMNVMTPFEPTPAVTLMKAADGFFQLLMQGVAMLLPDFPSLSTVSYVAEGFSIPGPIIGRALSIALAYVVGLTIAGYLLLRTREVAKD